jgi:peroxiredoxin
MLARLLVLVPLAAGCASSNTARIETTRASIDLGGIPLEALDGRRAPLSETLARRPTLIALWATWCETCATEFAALGRLAPKAEAQGAYVVAISEGESRDTVASFVHARALGYPHLIDEPFALGDALGARSVPTTIVLDRKGAVVYRGGALSREALVALDRAIAEKLD